MIAWRPSPHLLRALAAVCCFVAPTAHAQVAGSVALASDYRFRGHSISKGEPALTADLSYDDASGLYVGANVTADLEESSPELLNFSENAGFAHQLGTGPAVDVGFIRSDYTEYYSGGRKAHFTEVYAGVQARHFAAYVHYSPDYMSRNVEVLYGEVETAVEPAQGWRLNGHAGLLVRITSPPPAGGGRTNYDWEVGAARLIGHFELGLDLSGGGPGADYYQGRRHSRTALTGRVRWSF